MVPLTLHVHKPLPQELPTVHTSFVSRVESYNKRQHTKFLGNSIRNLDITWGVTSIRLS